LYSVEQFPRCDLLRKRLFCRLLKEFAGFVVLR
jgi:hypothetical protein